MVFKLTIICDAPVFVVSSCCVCRPEGSGLKDEVMKIAPVQKQTKAGQRTRFRVSAVLLVPLLVFFFPFLPRA